MLDAQGNPIATGPAEGGNPEVTGPDGAGTTHAPAAGAIPPAPSAEQSYQQLRQELDEERRLNQRYRANMDGSKQEVDRVKEELKQTKSDFDDWRQRAATVFTGQPAPGAAGVDPNQPLSLDRAVDAYMGWRADSGQPNPLTTYEQQLLSRASNQTMGQIYQALIPAQRKAWIEGEYPDELNFQKPTAAEVLALYDHLAADPMHQAMYPADQTWHMQLHPDTKQIDPATGQPRVIDMRLYKDAALRHRATKGQSPAPTPLAPVEGQHTGGAAPAGEEPSRPLLYDNEIIHDEAVQNSLRQAGRGRDKATLVKWYWEHMPSAEKNKRLALYKSGQWTGKR